MSIKELPSRKCWSGTPWDDRAFYETRLFLLERITRIDGLRFFNLGEVELETGELALHLRLADGKGDYEFPHLNRMPTLEWEISPSVGVGLSCELEAGARTQVKDPETSVNWARQELHWRTLISTSGTSRDIVSTLALVDLLQEVTKLAAKFEARFNRLTWVDFARLGTDEEIEENRRRAAEAQQARDAAPKTRRKR